MRIRLMHFTVFISKPQKIWTLLGGKSKVWRFLGFQVDDKGRQLNKKKVFCRVCKGRLPYSGNTTNLLYHLRTCHEEDYKTVSSSSSSSSTSSSSLNQTTLTSYVANSKPYTRSSSQFKKCEDALLTLICKDMLPVCIVDSPHLKLFIETLDPRYQPSSRTHFTLLNSITFCLFFGVSFNFVIFF